MLPLLLPDPGLRLDRIAITDPAVTLSLRTTVPASPGPRCAQPARQVHSRSTRHAHDLSIRGRPTLLCLTASTLHHLCLPLSDCGWSYDGGSGDGIVGGLFDLIADGVWLLPCPTQTS